MNEEDKEVLDKLSALYNSYGWETFLNELEMLVEESRQAMLSANSWDEFVEERGKVKVYNFLLTVKDMTMEMLNEEDS